MSLKQNQQWTLLIPTYAVGLFCILFVVSTFYYPGGSHADHWQAGFSWSNNYLCNLMGEYALNGTKNGSRIPAIMSVMILGIGIGYFFFVFPSYFQLRTIWKYVIRFLGVFSMVFAIFLFTDYHDLVLNIAGVMGVVAIIGTFTALKRNNSYGVLWLGAFSSLLLAFNAYSYYTGVLINWLPFIQKFSIVLFLLWIVSMNIIYYRQAIRV